MDIIWSHDEQKRINTLYAEVAKKKCPKCGREVRKYVESHYTGGQPCVLLAKYCRYCGSELKQTN